MEGIGAQSFIFIFITRKDLTVPASDLLLTSSKKNATSF